MPFPNDTESASSGKISQPLFILLMVGTAIIIGIVYYVFNSSLKTSSKILNSAVEKTNYWIAPDTASLISNPDGKAILYGRNLIAHTADYFGPSGKVIKGATNGMNCQSCHLDAGTKIFGNNYSAVASTYPKYRARSGTVENIYKRVNDCFQRSLNGKILDTASKEMKAITTYINWLGKGVQKGVKPAGSGLKDVTFLDRAADARKGQILYTQKCRSCHCSNGEGVVNADSTGFVYPPLWGSHSYTDGAGLYRVGNLAKFIQSNMPLGASYLHMQLSSEEAWDVAAYINTQPRPHINVSNDWPHLEDKPFDHPAGPYADGFSEQQHKYGPFKPIIAKLALIKKSHQ